MQKKPTPSSGEWKTMQYMGSEDFLQRTRKDSSNLIKDQSKVRSCAQTTEVSNEEKYDWNQHR